MRLGITAPIAITTGQALPTITPVADLWTVGPVSVNGTALQTVQSVKWNFGLKEEIVSSDGHAYPTFGGVTSREPRCAIEGLDVTALSTHGLSGLALTAFKTYFRKIASSGVRVPEATTTHVRLQGTGGMLLLRSARGQTREKLSGQWNIVPAIDGTNAVVQIGTAVANA